MEDWLDVLSAPATPPGGLEEQGLSDQWLAVDDEAAIVVA